MLEKKSLKELLTHLNSHPPRPPLTRTHTPWAVTCEITATLVRFVSEELYQLLNVPWRQVRRHNEAAVKGGARYKHPPLKAERTVWRLSRLSGSR